MIIAMVIGAADRSVEGRQGQMTGMPELVAQLHSFVGLPPCSWASTRSSREPRSLCLPDARDVDRRLTRRDLTGPTWLSAGRQDRCRP